jgi:uncharacterized RDD family membrane protein YckC
MTCPVCKRDLAPTLSICMACGAMINDTVREELETKISRPGVSAASNSGGLVAKSPMPPRSAPRANTMTSGSLPSMMQQPKPKLEAPKIETPKVEAPKPKVQSSAPPKPLAQRFDTADLRVKKTSPTLVEFQTKKATVPEWRLQLQNSVRQKVGTNRRETGTPNPAPAPQTKPQSTNGANALKVEFIEDDPQESKHQNPRVANALKRIEESRRAFANKSTPEQPLQAGKATPAQKNFRFNVVARSAEPPARTPGQKATVNPSPKPILVSSLKIEKKGYDTNKLPPLTKPAPQSRSFIPQAELPESKKEIEKIAVIEEAVEMEMLDLEPETDEIDDLAPFSMRFSAGLFDMIIGVFASLILLSPFIITGGTWLSLSGFFAIAATIAIVMFVYQTATIAFVGRTFGMRLFSLELVDIEENAYPTLHQAAVSSAVYLLSLTFAGIGFLPMFFNEERRAAHDILSGTILISEY